MDVLVRGEAELFARTAHLFASAQEIFCAANDLHTWAAAHQVPHSRQQDMTGRTVRKLYRPASLLQPGGVAHLRERERLGAKIRITLDEINETIVLDRKVAILAGDAASGERGYTVVTSPDVIGSVTSLFNAAWRAGTELAIYETEFAEVRALAPRILDELAAGSKDETAARALGLSVRTYRRRVAELMDALGATSRFQAGVRARQLGLV
ncbi:helix-turn-helix transcriptional regulator [Amycolatopsis tucumanensis]|uniref:Response regulator transcription factor n=1 Tax=Amycolatopsis tucumanensis TaxID=401106 RepID=A0ABP7I3S3_9PSEU|nr:DNA-binding response regulator [Amycolatopsis tucumanensis]MCF6423074.1 DNA-binding response regulator [Amycolatopsis tucumanensis]